nr:carboxypeptidase-like regulatory domain-containing protein [Segatella baroniae]
MTLTLALLFALVLDAAAQTVRGVVKDAAGTSLPGVTVLRNGDVKNGVITDLDGNYSIQANSADYLTFSYVGMKTQRVRWATAAPSTSRWPTSRRRSTT